MLDKKVQLPAIKSVNVRSNQCKAVDALDLTKRWMISPDQANNTVEKNTQRGIRTVINPQMSRRYPTNDWILMYPCLPHTIFTDIMIVDIFYKHGNNNSQVYGASFGWTCFSQRN